MMRIFPAQASSDERHRGGLPDKNAQIRERASGGFATALNSGNADTLKAHAPPQQSAKVTP